MGVGLKIAIDDGQVEAVDPRQQGLAQLAAADAKNLAAQTAIETAVESEMPAGQFQALLRRFDHLKPVGAVSALDKAARYHYVGAARERAAERTVCAPSHEQGVAPSELLEVAPILGESRPRQGAAAAYAHAAIDGERQGEGHSRGVAGRRGSGCGHTLKDQKKCGAGERNRTSDLLVTNQLLYRLSYPGVYRSRRHFTLPSNACRHIPPPLFDRRQRPVHLSLPEDRAAAEKKQGFSRPTTLILAGQREFSIPPPEKSGRENAGRQNCNRLGGSFK